MNARRWPFSPPFPERVKVDGREFRRARFQHPRLGVVAQYRETVPRHSLHLLVLAGEPATFVLDHMDRWNPDTGPGRALLHLVGDVLVGPKGRE